MESNDHKQIIQQGFDGVVAGYDHSTLSFFSESSKFSLKCLNFVQLRLKEIAEILGDVGVRFDMEVLVGVMVGVMVGVGER